jgi:hypothetical protein
METCLKGCERNYISSVLSPPCGMETHKLFPTIFPSGFPDRSKPTVWDGDRQRMYSSQHHLHKSSQLSSKPTVWDGDPYSVPIIPASLSSKPTVWDGDRVIPSTICLGPTLETPANSSKPTVWDGDSFRHGKDKLLNTCSKPTVWDGDPPLDSKVQHSYTCSKPTVWDGDKMGDRKSFRIFSSSLVLSPPCGMETSHSHSLIQ